MSELNCLFIEFFKENSGTVCDRGTLMAMKPRKVTANFKVSAYIKLAVFVKIFDFCLFYMKEGYSILNLF